MKAFIPQYVHDRVDQAAKTYVATAADLNDAVDDHVTRCLAGYLRHHDDVADRHLRNHEIAHTDSSHKKRPVGSCALQLVDHMLSTDVATVRVSNISSRVQKAQICALFENNGLHVASSISLCPQTGLTNAQQVATVTFRSPTEAKKAIALHGNILQGAKVEIEREFVGFTPLDVPLEATVDVVAIHGLNGHAYGTWCHHGDNKHGTEAMWLRDFLPRTLTGARVLVYGYSSVVPGSSTSQSGVKDFALDFLQRLLDYRTADQNLQRPLVLVCHSLGGIVAKQAIVIASEKVNRYPGISTALQSILFLATPHRGSKSANLSSLLSSIASLAFHRPPTHLSDTLKVDSRALYQISADFRASHSSVNIVNFYEGRKTSILNSLVVDEDSSRLGTDNELLIPIDATHSGICKFRGLTDANFLTVLAQLQRCCLRSESVGADGVIHNEKNKPSHTVRKGHFLVPTIINPLFFGRHEELKLLDEYLTGDQGRIRSSYPVIAVHGLGGIGKTELLTEYVHRRRVSKPDTSIFWVRATSEKDIEIQFQVIATTLSGDATTVSAPNGLLARQDQMSATQTGHKISTMDLGVDYVKEWMRSSDNEGWLLVLDNYNDITLDLRKFLPIDASGSVLLSTRNSQAIGAVANLGFELTALKQSDGEQLFLRIQCLGTADAWKSPEAHIEYSALKKIVEELYCFPLAIDQAAAFVRENAPMTLQEYLDLLRPRSENRELLMRFKQANPSYPESVMTTWEISLQYLKGKQPRAWWILQLLGFLDHSQISEDLLTAAINRTPWSFASAHYERELPAALKAELHYLKDDARFRIAIGSLSSLSLVKRKIYPGSDVGPNLYIHPLVHEWLRVRLNGQPELQAKFTIAALLILYQSFPIDLIVGLYARPFPMSKDILIRFDQVSWHMDTVLANVEDYYDHIVDLPLECFTLCEAYFLAGNPKHSIIFHEVPRTTLQTLDRMIRLMALRLPNSLGTIALFIHNVIVWLQNEKKNQNLLKTVSKITNSLKALTLSINIGDPEILFLMLLVTAVTDASDTVGELEATTSSTKSTFSGLEEQRHGPLHSRIKRSLFSHLHNLLFAAPLEPASRLVEHLALFIRYNLLTAAMLEESTDEIDFDILTDLNSQSLSHLDNIQKGAYLCAFAEFLCGHCHYNNWAAVRALFSLVLTECRAMLETSTLEAQIRKDLEILKTWSHSGYISSNFGRTENKETKAGSDEDILSPFSYIWTITLDAAVYISDPATKWNTTKASQISLRSLAVRSLTVSERKFALQLVLEAVSIYRHAVPLSSETLGNVMVFRHFRLWDVRLALIKIYKNLGYWSALQIVIWDALKCRAVLGLKRPFPWEDAYKPSIIAAAYGSYGVQSSPQEIKKDERARQAMYSSAEQEASQNIDFVTDPLSRNSVAFQRFMDGDPRSSDQAALPPWILEYPEVHHQFSYITNEGVSDAIAAFIDLYNELRKPPLNDVESLRYKLTEMTESTETRQWSLKKLALIHQLATLTQAFLHNAQITEGRRAIDGSAKLFPLYEGDEDDNDFEAEDTARELDQQDDDMIFDVAFE